jgi:Tfp pilus assembly protein PilF
LPAKVYAVAYLNRGIVYHHLKQTKEALVDFREAARLYQLQGKIDDYNDVLSRIKKLGG